MKLFGQQISIRVASSLYYLCVLLLLVVIPLLNVLGQCLEHLKVGLTHRHQIVLVPHVVVDVFLQNKISPSTVAHRPPPTLCSHQFRVVFPLSIHTELVLVVALPVEDTNPLVNRSSTTVP